MASCLATLLEDKILVRNKTVVTTNIKKASKIELGVKWYLTRSPLCNNSHTLKVDFIFVIKIM